MNYKETFEHYRKHFEEQLSGYLPHDENTPDLIREAMAYSLMAGGKRIRPILGLAAADLLEKGASERDDVAAYVTAVEMIHTYSLIHDDLPAMDNDSLRRGKATNHVVYGEAVAILAGDALLTRAFELMGECGRPKAAQAEAWALLAHLAGSGGMIGGQVMDIVSEGRHIELESLKKLQSLKTGALFQAPICGVALLLEADRETSEALADFAMHLGRAFQIRDDILDATSSSEKMGKTVGKDEQNEKATYVTLLGLPEAKRCLEAADQGAAAALERLRARGYDCAFLEKLTEELSGREY